MDRAEDIIKSQEDLMEMAHSDPRWIIERGLWVTNKQKEVVPFLFNDPQNMFYDERTTRDDLLKAGQLGISTEILSILTIKFLLVPSSWSVCISHEDEATKRLFERVEFFLKHLPPWLKVFYQPGKTSEGDIVNTSMNSKFYIGTAGARAFGRGDTIHYAHLSETSRWKGDGRLLTGVIRAVPLNDPKTWIVKETTANGEGNIHHAEYQRAKENREKGVKDGDGFISHFIPFFSNPDYRLKTHNLTPDSLTIKEKYLLQRFTPDRAIQNKGYIDLGNIAWRRQMIANLPPEDGKNPEDIFDQEFPYDDVIAFLSTGNPVFSTEHVNSYKSRAKECIAQGNLVGASGNYTMQEVPRGNLKLWDYPAVKDQFLIFADTAQHSDFCSAHVVDRKTWATIAVFHANIKAHAFGDELHKLGYFFNKAILAVEVNNMGQSTIDRLVDLNYPNLYMRRRFDTKEKKETKEYGWFTSGKTKSLMIGYMQSITNAEEVEMPDLETLQEMSTYINLPDGGMGASPGNNDDRVISVSGAYFLVKDFPYVPPVTTSNVVHTRVNKFRNFRRSKGSMLKK